MNAVERYLKQATRGLWGQKRRDAMTELRGAVEDKVYWHQVLGLSEGDAVTAALRDLGSPSIIARELSHVHTAPPLLRTTLLLGLTGLLGLQAAAQMTTVPSRYLPVEDVSQCRLRTAAERALMSATKLNTYDAIIAAQGGPESFLTRCATGLYGGVVMLQVADLLAGLRSAGVQVAGPTHPTSALSLTVFGGPSNTIPQASFLTTEIGGGRYLESSLVLPYLTRVTTAPLRLSGLTNPTLHIGAARVQLGTPDAPVQTTNLLAAALVDARRTDTSLPLPVVVDSVPDDTFLDPAAPMLGVPGQDGDLFAVVQNIRRVNGGERDTLWMRARTAGRIPFTDEVDVRPRLVTSLAALDAATARGETAALVFRLDASNLRKLRLTQVSAPQLHLIHQEQK